MEIVILITIIILTALQLVGFYFAKVSLYPETESYDLTLSNEIERKIIDEAWYINLNKTDFFIKSKFNYDIHCIWIPNKQSKKTVIISHGYTLNLNGSIRYIEIFYIKGYNVLIYDQRFHGLTGGKNCTFGFYEKYDLESLVSWVLEKTGRDSLVGVHGESMGAAIALLHGAIDDRISFIISDCAFESLKTQFSNKLKADYKLPSFPLLLFADIATKILSNTFYHNISPIKNIEKIKTPILFIHGDSDSFTTYTQTKNLYEKKTGIKKLYLAEGADHAQSILVNKEKYTKIIHKFLEEINC